MTLSHDPDKWFTSSRSQNNDDCVEVAPDAGQIRVRDTKNRAAGTLRIPAPAWSAFLAEVADRD